MKGTNAIVFILAMLCFSPCSFIILVLIGLYTKKYGGLMSEPEKPPLANMHVDDVMSVLQKWGYSKKDATTMVQAAIMNNPESGFEDLLRYSLNGGGKDKE